MTLLKKIDRGGVYTIAEMSANHAGKLKYALDIVRAAKDAGADCIKVQTYTADTMTLDCDQVHFKIKGGLWDGYTLFNLYAQASLPWEWQEQIMQEAQRCGLDFLSTPFDASSVDFLEQLGVQMYKVASYELTDLPLLRYIARTGKPVLLSTGMGNVQEIGEAVDTLRQNGSGEVILLKCTSEYPAHFEDINLAVMADMAKRFGVKVGFSDHSMGCCAPVVAVSLGACVIEKHFCLSREIDNPDSAFSMEPHEFAEMVTAVNQAATIRGSATYELTQREEASKVFRRSIFAKRDIAQGEKLTGENLCVIRPNVGIQPKEWENVLGKCAVRSLRRGDALMEEDILE